MVFSLVWVKGAALLSVVGMLTFVRSGRERLASPRGRGLVLWPGLGDACHSAGLSGLIRKMETRYDDLDIRCIDQGYGGVIGNVDEQIDEVCRSLGVLHGDMGYLGFSQGGLFLRILLQRCESLPAGPLVTLGSPHSGVTSWPSCPVTSSSWFCSLMDVLVVDDLGTWSLAREHIVPAAYLYTAESPAPLLDRANSCQDRTDLGGLVQLRNKTTIFTMFAFEDDEMIEPPESAWFARWDGARVVPLEEQDELACLRDHVPLETVLIPGTHMQIDEEFFFSDIVERYFVSPAVVT